LNHRLIDLVDDDERISSIVVGLAAA